MNGDPLYEAYHDHEWGVPEWDSRALWEKLVLDGFQAGLAWITILRKREAFRAAFADFDPEVVARFGAEDRARLMADAGIIRSNAKIDAAIAGARIYLDMRERGEDFSDFLRAFTGGAPIQNDWSDVSRVPAQTPIAADMAKALKAKGFKFCGPVIVYAFMQAVGMVNDHITDCFLARAGFPYDPALMAKPAARRTGPDMLLEAACPTPVCGVDEAGRGPLAGPVSAAAVIFHPRRVPKGLNDFKKLTAKARERLEIEIKAKALAWCVAFASVEEIAELNILHAAGLAMRRAVKGLALSPVFALVDGNYAFDLTVPVKTVVGGDGVCCSIAAASILAKTARDRLMVEMDGAHPGYGFADHKGYGAPAHLRALHRLGPCAIHRMSWAPIRLLLEGGDPGAADMAFDLARADDQHGV